MRAIKGFVVIGILSLAPVLASAAPNERDRADS